MLFKYVISKNKKIPKMQVACLLITRLDMFVFSQYIVKKKKKNNNG